jgi:hypothetical protein
MSLRSQLTEILPAILPPNPSESIKGTELIRLVRLQIDGNYSDASLRYHFSIMSCDPSAPLAKVEKGQGYYRRTAEAPALSGARELLALTQGRLDDLTGDQPSIDNALLRVLKFRAVLTRHFETNGLFPFPFIGAFTQNSPIGNLWRFPDLVLVNWETGEPPEEEMALDSAMLSLKQRLGLPPFRLAAARLRIVPTLQSYREDFFQTLAISHWAQAGELLYAAPIEDEALAEGLRRLAARYGIGVTSFGLDPADLDELPQPGHILNATPRETEAIMARIEIHRLAAPAPRSHLDWTELDSLRRESPEARALVEWLDSCLEARRAEPFRPDEP